MFQPVFTIAPPVIKSLLSIEANRQMVLDLPINVQVLARLRHSARLASTHYSTKIEGNLLTQEQVADALAGAHIPGRERDEAEVRNYYKALERVEDHVHESAPISELELRCIHGLVMTGRARPTPYRDGQNVIRDSLSGGIVYMPPEAKDLPALMADLFGWLNRELGRADTPAPVIAAIAHYQYATVHPYYDGNGRTARLLTTLVLHNAGYGLKGIYSLEEHYVRDLRGYYEALSVGPSHNYYLGRAEADITGFIDYFCRNMAAAFAAVANQAKASAASGDRDMTALLRRLDARQRRALELFHGQGTASAAELAQHLGLSSRTTSALCRTWVTAGFLDVADPSRKGRSYRLHDDYERLVGAR